MYMCVYIYIYIHMYMSSASCAIVVRNGVARLRMIGYEQVGRATLRRYKKLWREGSAPDARPMS